MAQILEQVRAIRLRRKMILFSNKLTFLEEAQTKPKDRNVIYLGSIIEIGDYG